MTDISSLIALEALIEVAEQSPLTMGSGTTLGQDFDATLRDLFENRANESTKRKLAARLGRTVVTLLQLSCAAGLSSEDIQGGIVEEVSRHINAIHSRKATPL